MIFLFDENLSINIAKALQMLGKPIQHLFEILPRSTQDEVLFRELSQRGWFLLTQDKKIKRNRHQREALKQAGVGAFIFTGKANKSPDQMTIKKLQHLDEIEHLANRTPRPFIFGISDRGSIERLG